MFVFIDATTEPLGSTTLIYISLVIRLSGVNKANLFY